MQVSENREWSRMSSQGWQYLPYLVVPMDTHGTTGMGYGIAMGQNFKHCTHTCTTHGPNTVGILIPMPNLTDYYHPPNTCTLCTVHTTTPHLWHWMSQWPYPILHPWLFSAPPTTCINAQHPATPPIMPLLHRQSMWPPIQIQSCCPDSYWQWDPMLDTTMSIMGIL